MILYGSSLSPFVRKTMAYLSEKGLSAELKPVVLQAPTHTFAVQLQDSAKAMGPTALIYPTVVYVARYCRGDIPAAWRKARRKDAGSR